MTRRNRDDWQRLEMAVHVTRKAGMKLVEIFASLVALGAILGAMMASPFAGDEISWFLFGASVGGFIVLIFAGSAAFLLADRYLQPKRHEAPDSELPDDLLSLGNRHLRLPGTWTEGDVRVYLAAVRDGFAAFSQQGMRGKLPDRPREDFNALLEWCVRGGFYECRNGGYDHRNGGTWLEDEAGLTLLNRLAREA